MKKIISISLLLLLNVSIAQTLTIQSFATGLSGVVDIAHPPSDERLFVVQQGGQIKIVNTNGTINTSPFIDLSSLIVSGGEQGLLGLAFHPNYTTNGQFFVNYTRASDGATVIAKYTVSSTNPNVANTAGTVLMIIAQPYANHNGGCIRFGPDGYLYIGMGDGGSGGDPGNRAQNINENLGKMLRIDVDNPVAPLNYGIPSTNPYVGIPGNDEIWAIGLRNPWKFSFNRLNDDLWIADVGQNAVEEINKVTSPAPAGLNFGWRCYEGNVTYNTTGCAAIGTMTMPIAQYSHNDGCSITGGYLYTGSLYPNLVGKYVFADYCMNRLGYMDQVGQITYTANFAGTNNFTTFGEDINGELYVAKNSTIYKIVDTSLSSSNFEKTGYSIFPNPAKEEIIIKNSNNFSNLKVTIFDVSGKVLLSQSIENERNKIETSALSSGIYLVKLEDKSGDFYSHKLVIE